VCDDDELTADELAERLDVIEHKLDKLAAAIRRRLTSS
jgi:hypothetical protein